MKKIQPVLQLKATTSFVAYDEYNIGISLEFGVDYLGKCI